VIPQNMTKFYINGAWVEPLSKTRMGVENPASEEIVCEVAMGNAGDAAQGPHRHREATARGV
jgi:aldehyde dehydrogenase (NAD+)